jgi:hypothetical protein
MGTTASAPSSASEHSARMRRASTVAIIRRLRYFSA